MELLMEILLAIMMGCVSIIFILLSYRISIPFIFKKGKEGKDAEKS